MTPEKTLLRARLGTTYALAAVVLAFTCSVHAVTYTWDATTGTAGAQDGGGAWNAANWWTGSADEVWPGSGYNADIGAGNGTAGTITLSAEQTVGVLTLKAAGSGNYTLSGSILNVATLAANASATINSQLKSTTSIVANSGATLSLGGGSAALSGCIFGGLGAVEFTGGNYTLNSNSQINTATVSLSNNTKINYNATLNIAQGTTTSLTIDNASMVTAGTGRIAIGRGTNANGTATLTSGTMNSGDTSNVGIAIAYGNNSKGTFNMQGGTVNTTILSINYGSTGTGTISISGGVVTTGTINFGAGTGGSGVLKMTGGSLYVGAGGIIKSTANTASITASGGTIGATESWSSSMDMLLDTLNGNIQFKAANAGNSARDINLSGALSGDGGLTKTGLGKLTLTGANSYAGGTVVTAGELTASDLGTGDVSVEGASILTLTSNTALDSAADMFLSLGAKVNLDFDGVLNIGRLSYDDHFLNIGSYTINDLNSLLGTSVFSGNADAALYISVPEPRTEALFATATTLLLLASHWRRRGQQA